MNRNVTATAVYGAGEGNQGGDTIVIEVPNPLGIQNQGIKTDVYKAWIAGMLFSAIDFHQHKNTDAEADRVLKMVDQFVGKVQGKYGGAFV